MAGDEEIPETTPAGGRPRPIYRGIEGEDFGRILALSDGIFAFAMTLLALSLTVPVVHGSTPAAQSGNLLNRLLADGPLFFGYAFAFVMIAVWWIIHNRTFQYIARYDSAVVWINMVLLIQIAFMPFVLSLFNDYSTTQVAVDLFAVIQITLGVTNLALWEYCRNHHLLKPNIPAGIARYYTYRGLLASGIFAVSIGVSFISVSFAEYVWIGTFIVQRFALRPRN
ncbi:MAG: TMEM175 family protein [Thermoplasmata archaeon]